MIVVSDTTPLISLMMNLSASDIQYSHSGENKKEIRKKERDLYQKALEEAVTVSV